MQPGSRATGWSRWTLILNSVAAQWGAYDYQADKDVLRVTATPAQAEHVESLEFAIDGSDVVLRWAELAVPFTVCLVVLGRHIEGLQFLEVMLGDEPALTQEQSFYQRALAGDSAEVTYQAEIVLKDEPLQAYLDDVALKGLRLAERDRERGVLDAENLARIHTATEELMQNLAEFEPRRWFRRGRAHTD